MARRCRKAAEQAAAVLRRNALAAGVRDDGHRFRPVGRDCRAHAVSAAPLARAAAIGVFLAIKEQQRIPLFDQLDIEHHRQRAECRTARIDAIAERPCAGTASERVEDRLPEIFAAVVITDQHRQHEIAARRDQIAAQRIVASHHPRQDRLDSIHHRDGLQDAAADRRRIIATHQQAGRQIIVDLSLAAAIGKQLSVEHRDRDDAGDRARERGEGNAVRAGRLCVGPGIVDDDAVALFGHGELRALRRALPRQGLIEVADFGPCPVRHLQQRLAKAFLRLIEHAAHCGLHRVRTVTLGHSDDLIAGQHDARDLCA